MNIFSCSDKGLVRSSNQDAFLTGTFDDGSVWAVVCDGMGGAKGGNVASRLGVDYFSAALKAGYRNNMSENSVKNLLESAVNAANIRVFDKACEDKELSGMGTTIVAVLIIGATAYFIHAGDSRAYVYSKSNLEQLTRDHSIVQSMVEGGKLSIEEARFHPRKNVITRALGVDESVAPEFNVCDLDADDCILLCTDGLSNYVSNERIAELLDGRNEVDCAKAMIDEANKNGGNDNITAVVIENI